MMNPKEKAEELVSKFENIKPIKMGDYSRIYYPTVKQCAIICVEEIIEAIDWHEFETPNDEIQFWQEVKQEIESL